MPASQAGEAGSSPATRTNLTTGINKIVMLKKFFGQPFFKDSKAVMLTATGFLLLMVHAIDFTLNVKSQEIKVPVRYSGYDASLSDKGHWFSLLSLLLFGIVMFIVNVAISIKVYRLRKTISIWMLVLNIVIMIFLILVFFINISLFT